MNATHLMIRRVSLAAVAMLLAAPAPAVLLRLPLDNDTSIHFYMDHDSSSGLSDWKCGTQTYDGHSGTDYTGANASRNTPIYAAASGTIVTAIDGYGDGFGGSTDGGGAGNHVVLAHSSTPQRTHYLHMNLGTVTGKSDGSSVSCGDKIGGIGNSGNATGLHLHFEPRVLSSGSYVADDPYAGTCGGPTSFWVYQTGGSPTTSCQGSDLNSPSSLVATPVSSSQINLNWIDNTGLETSYQVERASYITGPWTLIAILPANSTSYSSTNLLANSTFFFRVKAFNSVNESPYCNVRWATTSNTPPNLGGISDKSVNEGSPLSFTATAVDFSAGRTWVIGSFEDFDDGTANGSVLFHSPRFTLTTIGSLDSSPNLSSVTAFFPIGNGFSRRTLLLDWSFASGVSNRWMRLSTQDTTNIPNPTVGFGQVLRFDVFTDRSLKVALGIRETNTGAEPAQDGGSSGPIEFVGVTNVINGQPVPTHTIDIRSWQNVSFNLATEPVRAFTGNGMLESTTGKGVLEHLAFVPNDGSGEYRVWLDNMTLFQPNLVTFSLDPGAPAGAAINSTNGLFAWTPAEDQGPGVYSVTIRATDNGTPPMSDARTFTITVNEVNAAPTLTPVTDRIVNAGAVLTVTNVASDPDLPANLLTYSLDPGAPVGAQIDPTNGVFTWLAPTATVFTTNTFTIRVLDNGSPALGDTNSFKVVVVPPPSFAGISRQNDDVVLSWPTFPGKSYRLQFKADIEQPSWTDIGGPILASGNSLSITNSPGPDARRFYRIVQVN